jgi:hypothetical protein
MPLIWTNSDNRVTRIHYKPEKLSHEQKQSAKEVAEIPDRDYTKDGVAILYHTDEDGFWHEYVTQE